MPTMSIKDLAETDFIKVYDEWDRKRGRRIVYKKIFIGIDPDNAGISSVPDPGVPAGLTSIEVQSEDGVTTVLWNFECEPEVADPYFELEGSVETKPITKHPDIFKIAGKYARGLKDGEVDWYYKDPTGGAAGDSGLSSDSGGGGGLNINPFYGVTDYYNGSAVVTYTEWYKTRSSIPASITNGVAKIENPIGLSGADYGQWLCIGARIQQTGDAFRVSRSWMASAGDTHWNSELYG